MKIKMNSTQTGSVDGIRATQYEEGKEYDLTGNDGERELAGVFVAEGWAVEIKGSSKSAEPAAEAGDEVEAQVASKKAKK